MSEPKPKPDEPKPVPGDNPVPPKSDDDKDSEDDEDDGGNASDAPSGDGDGGDESDHGDDGARPGGRGGGGGEAKFEEGGAQPLEAKDFWNDNSTQWLEEQVQVEAERENLSAVLNELIDLNGFKDYDVESYALGNVKEDEYLVLPRGLIVPQCPPVKVGTGYIARQFSADDIAQIFMLNYNAAPAGEDKVKFAVLRLEAVKSGWYTGEKEVKRVERLDNAFTLMKDHANAIKAHMRDAKTVGFLQPLFAEFVFRTLGHHYLTSLSNDYIRKYEVLYRACLVPGLASFLSPSALFHSSLHWVGPARARAVLLSHINMDTGCIPDAIKLRATAAPAGTALITSTCAILDTMKSSQLYGDLVRATPLNLDELYATSRMIKDNPPRFHQTYFAYGAPPLTAELKGRVERAKLMATQLAPVTQAYIEVYSRKSDLAKIKAIKKHADSQPVVMRALKTFFSARSKAPAATLAEILNPELTEPIRGGRGDDFV